MKTGGMKTGGMKDGPGHLYWAAGGQVRMPEGGCGYGERCRELAKARSDQKRVVLIVTGFSFGRLFIGVFLLRHLFTELTFPVAVHGGFVFVDATLGEGGCVAEVVGNEDILAEGLSKKREKQKKGRSLPNEHDGNFCKGIAFDNIKNAPDLPGAF
jgi:hypothetical protein